MEKCPLAVKGCGGCSYQGTAYEQQLKTKDDQVRKLLNSEVYEGIVPCPVQYGYRNKMEYTFGNECKDGPMLLGLHRKGSYISILDASDCQIVPAEFNVLVKKTLEFCLERGYTQFHKKLHYGFLRNLILRKGMRTGELLVNIVTSGIQEFDEAGYVEMIRGLEFGDKVVGILHTVNNNPSDALTVEELRVLSGRPYYIEEIMGLKFKVGAFSFFQTNVDAAERLYLQALELIPDIEGKTVFDLYCGTGTITQAMALKAKEAIGVEIVAEAVESAKANAELNGLTNCRFLCGDVQDVLGSLSEKPDVIVVDPPRMGISAKALPQILGYGVDQILYISCNPKTLAENLRQAAYLGYKPVVARAYDNFPFTAHVEVVSLLSRTAGTTREA